MSELARLRYISRFSRDFSAQELDELVTHAAAKNATRDITGVLMANGGIFYQILEGPADALASLYERILVDERHTDVLLLDEEHDIEERFFGGWSMRSLSADALAQERLAPVRMQLESIMDLRRQVEQSTRKLEAEVWGELQRLVRTGAPQIALKDGVVGEI